MALPIWATLAAAASTLALPAIAVGGLVAGSMAAEHTGEGIARAGQAGFTPAAIDEYGNPIGYRDAAGKYYDNDEADRLGAGSGALPGIPPDRPAQGADGAPTPSVLDRLRNMIGGGAGQSGKVDVKVTIDGAPAGTTVRATGSGITSNPMADVGWAFPGAIPAQ